MIWVGIDDTDMPDTPGTNQLARQLAARAAGRFRCHRIVRHQLSGDPAIPCTSKNGSASLWFEPLDGYDPKWLRELLVRGMLEKFVDGSDPGLCIAEDVPEAVQRFGRLAQQQIVTQHEARSLATAHGIHLEGLGGTQGGVIGALAAVGLAAPGDDGRVIQFKGREDDLSGPVPVAELMARGVAVCEMGGNVVERGIVDVGKKLRPNCRNGEIVLMVLPAESPGSDWTALKLP